MTAVPRPSDRGVRADLHCHSNASSEAGEALLEAIRCPESFSEPAEVYAQAKRRGMDFVTITDHDSIEGVAQIIGRPDVLVGEELTCYFPEDRCKMHVLLWGITRRQHDELQAAADDLYEVARYIERHRIAHAVAHPVYRQNDRLELWHLQRLLLLFKGFECLNGAHSLLHRRAFEPLLDELTSARLGELSARHGIEPLWPVPWHKARTGGSDDHGLFNIGRTWTEFPHGADSVERLLDCLREGRCAPGGEAGSSLKLAHNFYSVGIRYATRRMGKGGGGGGGGGGGATGSMLKALVGERPLRTRDLVRAAVGRSVGAVGQRIRRPLAGARKPSGSALLTTLFRGAAHRQLIARPPLLDALGRGESPMAEHQAMFDLVCALDSVATSGIASSVASAIGAGQIGPVFDALSAVAMQQFLMLPYYFALFHQNRERHVLARVTGAPPAVDRQTLKVGVFTDTFEETNGVSRFLQTLGAEAQGRGLSLTIHTCTPAPRLNVPYRTNFTPAVSCPLPRYPQLSLSLPPVVQVLEWADRQQFDAIHVHTPGPMGLCGWLAASMLRVPLLGTYHTDFPAYVNDHTADHRLTTAAESYMRWFYGRAETVMTRSRGYEQTLHAMGIEPANLRMVPPCVDGRRFRPQRRDVNLWNDLRVREPYRLLYCGRVSPETNLAMLAKVFRRMCGRGCNVALVIAGDGPYMATLQGQLKGLPAYFLGKQEDERLAALYASSDLLLFPSKTDTLGQVVLEAQAAGLPVLVSDQGGPAEIMDDGLTGLILPADDVSAWADAIDGLLRDEPRRMRMARTAPHRVARYTIERTFDAYWDEHVRAAREAAERHAVAPPPPVASVPISRGAARPAGPGAAAQEAATHEVSA